MGEVYMTVPPSVVPGVARILTPESGRDRVAGSGRRDRMDGIRDLLETARANGLAAGRFRGLLHIAIGRTVTSPDGTRLSAGLTWRELANLLKALRFDPELGRELGADPDTLSPRDRERYWYAVIALARVDGADAVADADKLVGPLKALGYVIAPPPGGIVPPARTRPPAAKDKPRAEPVEEKPAPGKKKKK